MGAPKMKARAEPGEDLPGSALRLADLERAAGPNPICAGCRRKPADERDRADWMVAFAGSARGETARCGATWVCSEPCLVAALRAFANSREVALVRAVSEAMDPGLASDRAWQGFLDAPLDEDDDTEEERRAADAADGPTKSQAEIMAELAKRWPAGR